MLAIRVNCLFQMVSFHVRLMATAQFLSEYNLVPFLVIRVKHLF